MNERCRASAFKEIFGGRLSAALYGVASYCAALGLTLGLSLVLSMASAQAVELIDRFESTVDIAGDSSLTVTETIRVNAEGAAIRRGIFRDFPRTFRDANGTYHMAGFTVVAATRDGKPEPYHTKSINNGTRVFIGDEKVFVPNGLHTYVLTYRTTRQIRWFNGTAELNWNVTGNFWNFPINAAVYRLNLPNRARPVRWTAFTGAVGARGTDWQGAIDANNVLTVRTTRRLTPGEGLTVAAELPGGVVSPPTQGDLFWYWLVDYRHWLIGGFGFVATLFYYLLAWRAVGRDPKGSVVIPEFHPPENVSPALANYVDNWGLGREKWRAFTAAALSLATRGLLKFDQDGDALTLRTTGRTPDGGAASLPGGERAIFDWVGRRGGQAVIDKTNGSSVAKAGTDFTAAIVAENKNKFFHRNIRYVVAGVVMTVVVLVAIFISGSVRQNDVGVLVTLLFGGFFVGMFMMPVMSVFMRGFHITSIASLAITLVVVGVFIAIGIQAVSSMVPDTAIGDAFPAMWSFVEDNPFGFIVVAAFATLNGLFVYLMKAPTVLGRSVMDHLAGLKLYLETAEKDRLNMQAPELTAQHFEALLPYAVALGVEKPWADAFNAALRRAHPDADPATLYQPGWGSRHWSGMDFGRSVSSVVSTASSAFESAVPASSGSSGFSSSGGGSGGGGGGGGGGGW